MDHAPNHTIVVIENDSLTLEFLRDMLELWGYAPQPFRDPSEALQQIRSGALVPALLVVDLHLDGQGSGDAVIRQVRELPGLGSLPAFVATGDLAYRPQGLPGVQVLTKPIRPDRLKQVLKTLFPA